MRSTDTTRKFQMRLEDLISHQQDESPEKLSQSKIAKEIGIEKGSLGKYLNDQAEIGINGLCKFADYFGVTTDYLLGRSNAYSSDVDIQTTCATIGLDQTTVETIRDLDSESKNILTCLLAFPPFRQMLFDMQELAVLYRTRILLNEDSGTADFWGAFANIRIMPDKFGFVEYKINKKLQKIIDTVAESISSPTIEEYAQAELRHLIEQARSQYSDVESGEVEEED